jgi:hypothetical protein
MRRRHLQFLLAGGLVMAVLAAIVVWRGDRGVSHAPTGQQAAPGLAAKLGDLARLRLARGKMTVNFALVDRRWTVVEKGNYPADQDRVRRLLLQLAELELIEPKTDRPELLARLDLDDPANGKSTLVTAQDRNGALAAQLIIGRSRPNEIGNGEAGVYVRNPDSDQAWLARGEFDLTGDARSWLDRRIIDIAPERVATIVLTAPDGNFAILTRGSPDQPFAIDGLPADAHPKPDAVLTAPAAALAALDLDDVKQADVQPIAQDGATTAALTTFDGLVLGLRLSPSDTGDWLAIDATGSETAVDEAKALSARLARWSFAIPAERARLLRTTLADLLLPGGS